MPITCTSILICHILGEYPRCWRKAKRQCPELVYGLPSLKTKTFSVTSVDGYVEIGIHKIDGSDPGVSRERSSNAFRTLHREVGNLYEEVTVTPGRCSVADYLYNVVCCMDCICDWGPVRFTIEP